MKNARSALTLVDIAVTPQVVLDLGRKPEARFAGSLGGEYLRDEEVCLCWSVIVSDQQINQCDCMLHQRYQR